MMKLTSINKTRGFTLIELLVVIAIIGILSSVVLASLSTARAKSRDARRVADIDQLRTSLEMYYDSNSTYPTTTAAIAQTWDTTGAFTNDTAGAGIRNVATAGNIAKIPNPPSASGKYYYCSASSTTGWSGVANCTSGSSATAYVLGADLERTDNSALKTDADVSAGTNFIGTGATCVTAGTAQPGGTELCYDITN